MEAEDMCVHKRKRLCVFNYRHGIKQGTSSLLVCVVTTANAVSNALYLTTVILIHKIFIIYLFIYIVFSEMHYKTVMKNE